MKIRNVQVIDLKEWDGCVKSTYNRPYSFQQQDGCRPRGTFELTVPDQDNDYDEEMADSVPEVVNGKERGAKFAVWLARDPKQKMEGQTYEWELELWWERNFYPDVQTVANDLHARGLLAAGDYMIEIDW